MSFTINGTMPNLNDYIDAMNSSRYAGNSMKNENTNIAAWCSKADKRKYNYVHITFKWFEPNMKRDMDNIAFAKKFILDGMVKSGLIKNDGWKYIEGFTDKFFIDKENPRIEVIIEEVEL